MARPFKNSFRTKKQAIKKASELAKKYNRSVVVYYNDNYNRFEITSVQTFYSGLDFVDKDPNYTINPDGSIE